MALPAPKGTNPWLEGSEIVSMPAPNDCYINMVMSPGQSQPGGDNQVQILNYADCAKLIPIGNKVGIQ